MPLWCLHSSQSDDSLSDDITMQETRISTQSPTRGTDGNWYRSSVRSLLNGLPSWKKAKVRVFMNSMEIVHDGWLIKSPPEKKIWKAKRLFTTKQNDIDDYQFASSSIYKWRKRWFVLRHSGQLPGQFLLEYYTDSSRKKLKGKIDLDQCEQVDAGLTFECRKYQYQYMFDLKTPKRTYFLVAESQQDMNKWVDCICSVCGLKKEALEETDDSQVALDDAQPVTLAVQSQPESRTSLTEFQDTGQQPSDEIQNEETSPSSPGPSYIELGTCFSGSSPLVANGILKRCDSIPDTPPPPPPKSNRESTSSELYDIPRPHNVDLVSPTGSEEFGKPLHSPGISSYNEEEWMRPPSSADWGTRLFPSQSIESLNAPKIEAYDVVPTPKKIEGFKNLISPEEIQSIVNDMPRLNINNKKRKSLPHRTLALPNTRKISHPDLHLSSLPPPPRPPKPSALDSEERNYINLSNQTSPVSPAYDIPPAARNIYSNNTQSDQFFVFGNNTKELNPDSTVPLPPLALTDDIYDFPKSLNHDDLKTTSVHGNKRKHPYCNAPTGYLANLDNTYFDMNGAPSEETELLFSGIRTSLYTDMSKSIDACKRSNSVGAAPPPVVNRGLKPEKKLSVPLIKGSNGVRLPSSPRRAGPPVDDAFTISGSHHRKNFKRPESSGTNGSNIPLPRRTKSRLSSSDDDQDSNPADSRRNSDLDGVHSQNSVPSAPKPKTGTVEYLDLDLESEMCSQKSPKPKSPDRFSSSNSGTVYKTVDFVKTVAFNQTRHTVEENYRKSRSTTHLTGPGKSEH